MALQSGHVCHLSFLASWRTWRVNTFSAQLSPGCAGCLHPGHARVWHFGHGIAGTGADALDGLLVDVPAELWVRMNAEHLVLGQYNLDAVGVPNSMHLAAKRRWRSVLRYGVMVVVSMGLLQHLKGKRVSSSVHVLTRDMMHAEQKSWQPLHRTLRVDDYGQIRVWEVGTREDALVCWELFKLEQGLLYFLQP